MIVRLMFALMLALPLSAAARDLTPDQRQALVRTAADYMMAHHGKDADWLVGIIPPRILDIPEGARGDAIRKEMVKTLRAQLEGPAAASVVVDIVSIEFGRAPDGTPYGLVPIARTTVTRDETPTQIHLFVGGQLQTQMVVNEYRTTVSSHFVGLLEAGKWYLVELSRPAALKGMVETYPAFEGVAFPEPQTAVQVRQVPVRGPLPVQ